MPHLSQLQRDYKDKHVTIIGMTSPDKTNTLEAVHAMVEDKGDGMDYTVAFDEERTTNEAWMKAAQQKGIPTSFLVDKSGKIAWIGHPSSADIPISRVVAGTWDYVEGPALMKRIAGEKSAIYKAMRKEPKKALELFKAYVADYPQLAKGMDSLHFSILAQIPEQLAAATRAGKKLVDHAIKSEDSNALNSFAWGLVDPGVERENRFLDLALRAASRASEFEQDNGAILDTVARVHFWRGDLELALKTQSQAVECAEGEMKTALEKVLEEYEQALAEQHKS